MRGCSLTEPNLNGQVPILGELALNPRTDFNRPVLLAIYTPFILVMPRLHLCCWVA